MRKDSGPVDREPRREGSDFLATLVGLHHLVHSVRVETVLNLAGSAWFGAQRA